MEDLNVTLAKIARLFREVVSVKLSGEEGVDVSVVLRQNGLPRLPEVRWTAAVGNDFLGRHEAMGRDPEEALDKLIRALEEVLRRRLAEAEDRVLRVRRAIGIAQEEARTERGRSR
jgi:hypothetical protein